MKKICTKQNVVIVLLLFFCITSGYNIFSNYTTLHKLDEFSQVAETADQYTLYIGLNDKDKNEQIISTEDAKSKIQELILEHTSGYTIYETQGGWLGDQGMQYKENSIACVLSYIDEATVNQIMDKILIELNQASIMVVKQKPQIIFYDGANDSTKR